MNLTDLLEYLSGVANSLPPERANLMLTELHTVSASHLIRYYHFQSLAMIQASSAQIKADLSLVDDEGA